MSVGPLLFWVFSAMVVVGGLMAVLLPRIVHAVFSLLLCFTGVAAVYVLAGADFLAITQIVIYVGGVLVLIAFGILLTGRTSEATAKQEARSRKYGLAIGLVLFFGLMKAIGATSQFRVGENPVGDGTTEDIGKLLLGDYIIPFEFASILLLVALVGSAYLVRRHKA